jgi:hypothetical protein
MAEAVSPGVGNARTSSLTLQLLQAMSSSTYVLTLCLWVGTFPCPWIQLIGLSAATEVLVPSSHVITHVEGIQALRK